MNEEEKQKHDENARALCLDHAIRSQQIDASTDVLEKAKAYYEFVTGNKPSK